MKIHSKLNHKNIIKIIESGEDGKLSQGGKKYQNLVYIIMDYVPEGLLFDIIESLQGVGEIVAHYFIEQVIEGFEYLQKKQVSHLDTKLENILVDSNMRIKIIDFGFSSVGQKSVQAYGGTKVYMAPEILERKSYDGFKADIFAIGVLLFISTIGNFPFVEASKSDKYYSLLSQTKLTDEFW